MSYWTWTAFSLCSAALAGYLALCLQGDDRTAYLPGQTSDGHYQIELSCDSCHTPLGGVRSNACLACHGAELTQADDSHPPSKFLDPRNALLIEKLDARECMTCHTEHRPHLTGLIGVTLPRDYCVHCHADIGDERPSHVGLDHAGCQSAGCHNFHDNRGLHEDYLEVHLNEPMLTAAQNAPRRVLEVTPTKALSIEGADADATLIDEKATVAWSHSAHARAGVNCSGCHGEGQALVRRPDETTCANCHERQVAGFKEGKHGMRLAVGLEPMRPELARLPFKSSASGKSLGCQSCHGSHEFDTSFASFEACTGCHDDQHTRAFEGSPHALSLRAERDGRAPKGSGVSCATCHLPVLPTAPGAKQLFVQHNQNDNLRPNDKMLRTVCTHCHGLAFSIDALADAELVQSNFRGRPKGHVQSIDWVKQRRTAREARAGASESNTDTEVEGEQL